MRIVKLSSGLSIVGEFFGIKGFASTLTNKGDKDEEDEEAWRTDDEPGGDAAAACPGHRPY